MLSIPLVKEIVELPDAVCVYNKVIAPPVILAGNVVIADKELLFAKLRAIDYLLQIA